MAGIGVNALGPIWTIASAKVRKEQQILPIIAKRYTKPISARFTCFINTVACHRRPICWVEAVVQFTVRIIAIVTQQTAQFICKACEMEIDKSKFTIVRNVWMER